MKVGNGWPRASKVIDRMDLVGIMQDNLQIVKRELPDYTVGELWCVGHISEVADMLMEHIEHRFIVEEKRLNKNKEEGKNGKG